MSPDASLTGSTRGQHWLGRLMRSRGFAWGISVVLHVVLFVVFYQMGFARAADSRRVIIPEARLAAGPSPATPRTDQPVKLADPPLGASATAGRAPRLDELAILTVDVEPDAGRAAISGGPIALPGVDFAGASDSLRPGGSGAAGPISRFFGQAGNAYKIVYVVDVSASLMIHIDQIIREMQDSVRDLVASQEFHIVLAMPREVREIASRRLVPANARYKTAAYDFIRAISGVPKPGKADPIEAMKRAFATKPELIYFLTDGDYPDIEDELEAVLKRLNAQSETRITVIGFDPSPAPRALLERIARAHGGHCRFVEPK